jgi:hypothetical protein
MPSILTNLQAVAMKEAILLTLLEIVVQILKYTGEKVAVEK